MGKPAGNSRKTVVLIGLPYQGHLNPLLQLGTVLHSKGFSITIIHTEFNAPNTSNHPDFVFVSAPVQEPKNPAKDFASQIILINSHCEAPFREVLGKMIQEKKSEIACIVYDAFIYCAESVASHYKLKGLVLRPTNAANGMIYNVYPKLKQQGRLPLPSSMLEDMIDGHEPLRYKDLPIARTTAPPEVYLRLTDNLREIKSSAVIWNTVECLEQSILTQLEQQYKVPIFSIGPLQDISKAAFSSLMEEDKSCITWLDKQPRNSVLYVSIGSVTRLEEKELAEMAWGLANSKQRFLWVVRPGSVAGSEWMELIPEGFKDATKETCYIVKWAPQREVLAHPAVGGFWTHCGWNSSLESISEGVPMICKPSFGDQMINARFLSQVWKIGVYLEGGFERAQIEKSVRTLMAEKDGEEMRKRSMDLREKVQSSIKEGGSSSNALSKLLDFIK